MISQLLWLKETENGTIDERGYYAELLVKGVYRVVVLQCVVCRLLVVQITSCTAEFVLYLCMSVW